MAETAENKLVDYTERNSAGAKMTCTSRKMAAPYKKCFPAERVGYVYLGKIWPTLEKLGVDIRGACALMQTGDLLLPKLMSGEIRLRDVEKAVEAVA